ncbi:hypothetical protein CIB48_g3881 [Xylaria polymorpha]|nr:hypothetical protein CIB48_g3881 [Xylaria polymorpha]
MTRPIPNELGEAMLIWLAMRDRMEEFKREVTALLEAMAERAPNATFREQLTKLFGKDLEKVRDGVVPAAQFSQFLRDLETRDAWRFLAGKEKNKLRRIVTHAGQM